MHGRLKVKTTAEKEAEKKKEREKKKAIYQKCMNKIRGLFMSGDRSVVLLNLITKVLENIPEFGTLWNWRRIVLLEIFRECVEEKCNEDELLAMKTTEKDNEVDKTPNKADMIISEKLFVARCLEVNPKAYSLWSHRRWLVEQDPSESVIKEELSLCNLFLKYDERNFHCWDYRRTTLLDTENMGVVRDELEWTQNAYFTDPSDQSVWLYYQWLLGREVQGDKVLAVYRDSDNSTIHVLINNLTYTPPSQLLIKRMSNTDENTDENKVQNSDDNTDENRANTVTWKSSTSPSRLWSCDISNFGGHVTITLGDSSVTLSDGATLGVDKEGISPLVKYTAPRDLVEEQLGNIRELYELEPDNKWVILTYLDMVNTCNPHKSKEQITEIRNLTVKLCHVDSMRTGFYRDLWTKLLCETAVTAWWSNTSRDVIRSRDPLNLSKKYLTKLAHSDYMFALHEVDLSHNNLTSLTGFSSLVAVEKLNLSNNKIHSLEGLEGCKNLKELDASHNQIHNACGILACTKCRLRALHLVGNPLAATSVYPACVVQSCSMLCTLDDREL
ncbi:hypothetical protein ACHWQZ_G001184 [Mnemiopsis leidyi]